MNADIRRKLAMAARVRDFATANPVTGASFAALLTRFGARLDRGEVLAVQENQGHISQRAAVARRDGVRHSIREHQLRRLVGIAQFAASDHPEVTGMFILPAISGANKKFITAAKAMAAAIPPFQELFVSLGLGESFVDDLTQALATFDSSATDADTSRLAHIGARAELKAVSDDCVKEVRLIGTYVRSSYADSPDLLADWESASNIGGPRRVVAVAPVVPPAVP